MHRLFQNGQGCPWFYAAAMFLQRKNSRPEVYTDVHFWTVYFKRLTESMFYDMLLLKILNVSERTGTGVVLRSSDGDVSKVGYFFDIPASLKLSLYTVMT